MIVCLAVNCLNTFSFPAHLFQIIGQYLQWLFLHWEGTSKREYVSVNTELKAVHPLSLFSYF